MPLGQDNHWRRHAGRDLSRRGCPIPGGNGQGSGSKSKLRESPFSSLSPCHPALPPSKIGHSERGMQFLASLSETGHVCSDRQGRRVSGGHPLHLRRGSWDVTVSLGAELTLGRRSWELL